MRDRGGDSVPPDVRFAGRSCADESSALDDRTALRPKPRCPAKLDGPPCEAKGHITTVDQVVTASTNLWTRGAVHTNPGMPVVLTL